MNELRILFSLQFNPYVLDVREQYGMYEPVTFWNAVGKGELLLRTDLMTIDAVVTHLKPGRTTLYYHGISIKPADYAPDDEERRREQREVDTHAERGWTWELMRGNAVSQREFANNFVLYQAVAQLDVLPTYEHALWFSRALLKSRATGTTGSVLGRLARSLGISDEVAQQLFSVGVSNGFLTVDHSEELRMDKPMNLIR